MEARSFVNSYAYFCVLATARAMERERVRRADFLQQTGRQRDSSRSQIGTFGRSEVAKATWAAKKAFANPEEYATIKAIRGARIINVLGSASTEHAARYCGLVQSMTTGLPQGEAHILASQKYNYLEESDAFYGTLEKHKNK